jgi:hypothetical protein
MANAPKDAVSRDAANPASAAGDTADCGDVIGFHRVLHADQKA